MIETKTSNLGRCFIEKSLEHHGVLGMKWGHRNSSNTSSSNTSSSKTKQAWSTKKKVAVGAAATVGIGLAAYGAYKLHDSHVQRLARTSGGLTNSSFKVDASLSKKMDAQHIMKDIVSKVNPGYGEPGTESNCRRCTFAYELRRRGFDVQATKSVGRRQGPQDLVTAISGGSKTHDLIFNGLGKRSITLRSDKPGQNASRIFNTLKQHPEGARGELAMSWGKRESAHSMAWEIVKGNVHVFDAQTGAHYTTGREFHSIAKHISDAGFTRLDDLELNGNFVAKWVKNVK